MTSKSPKLKLKSFSDMDVAAAAAADMYRKTVVVGALIDRLLAEVKVTQKEKLSIKNRWISDGSDPAKIAKETTAIAKNLVRNKHLSPRISPSEMVNKTLGISTNKQSVYDSLFGEIDEAGTDIIPAVKKPTNKGGDLVKATRPDLDRYIYSGSVDGAPNVKKPLSGGIFDAEFKDVSREMLDGPSASGVDKEISGVGKKVVDEGLKKTATGEGLEAVAKSGLSGKAKLAVGLAALVGGNMLYNSVKGKPEQKKPLFDMVVVPEAKAEVSQEQLRSLLDQITRDELDREVLDSVGKLKNNMVW